MNTNQKDKNVFVITPIGDENSDVRRAAEGVIDAAIIPVLEDLGFKQENISVAHRISKSGSINKQIINRIVDDELAIVNLTGLNPNVMYELALRHAIRKPVVQICELGTRLPFDIVDERTIFYTNDMKGVLDLKKQLFDHIKDALDEHEPDNPIYRAITEKMIIKKASVENLDINISEYMIKRLDSIEQAISMNDQQNSKNYKFENTHDVEDFRLAVEIRAKQDIVSDLPLDIIKGLIFQIARGLTAITASPYKKDIKAGESEKLIFQFSALPKSIDRLLPKIEKFDSEKYSLEAAIIENY
ncbi:hypothetical protein ACP2W0_08380 [Pseudobacillus badius]|uniref:hypothetical protein n=1 Tax=Bacillus badius TaxID=1455 RepID=UPI003CE7DCF8